MDLAAIFIIRCRLSNIARRQLSRAKNPTFGTTISQGTAKMKIASGYVSCSSACYDLLDDDIIADDLSDKELYSEHRTWLIAYRGQTQYL